MLILVADLVDGFLLPGPLYKRLGALKTIPACCRRFDKLHDAGRDDEAEWSVLADDLHFLLQSRRIFTVVPEIDLEFDGPMKQK